jgi:hypothetical protein
MVREHADANSGARIALDRQRIAATVACNNQDVMPPLAYEPAIGPGSNSLVRPLSQ